MQTKQIPVLQVELERVNQDGNGVDQSGEPIHVSVSTSLATFIRGDLRFHYTMKILQCHILVTVRQAPYS